MFWNLLLLRQEDGSDPARTTALYQWSTSQRTCDYDNAISLYRRGAEDAEMRNRSAPVGCCIFAVCSLPECLVIRV